MQSAKPVSARKWGSTVSATDLRPIFWKGGTDIRYIKDLLGPFDIQTIERYLHGNKSQLVNVVSPLDDLLKKGGVKFP